MNVYRGRQYAAAHRYRDPALRSLVVTVLVACALLLACAGPHPIEHLSRPSAAWPPEPLAQPRPGWEKENLPYFWPYPEVPPPKWPEAHPDAKPEPGMSPTAYFNKLCRLEAGMFVYRRVENVSGFYLIRPRIKFGDEYGGVAVNERLLDDLYAIEDPLGWFDIQASLDAAVTTVPSRPSEHRYDYIEVPNVDVNALPAARHYFPYGKPKPPYLRHMIAIRSGIRLTPDSEPQYEHRDIMIRNEGIGPYSRYERSEKPLINTYLRDKIKSWWKGAPDLSDYPTPTDYLHYPIIETRVSKLRSRYGLLWRGIDRPLDRQMGIAGSELIVVDLATNEILGVRRGFALATARRNDPRFNWYDSIHCPRNIHTPIVKQVIPYRNDGSINSNAQ